MIRIPLKEHVVLTTLGFDSILNRLDTAIAVPEDTSGEVKPYIGEIYGFKFWASRLIGNKHLHLPSYLLPKIEGRIYELHTGYQISLIAKLHRATSVFLLICLGGLLAYTFSSLLDNIFSGVTDFKYLQDIAIFAVVYLLINVYFYLAAKRGMNFFKVLFVQRLLGASEIYLNPAPTSSRQISAQMSVFSNRLRNNLPQLRPSSDRNSASMSAKIPNRERNRSQ